MALSDFRTATPHEVALYLEGYSTRRSTDQELGAWVAANIMNCWASKGRTVTVDQLLGRSHGEIRGGRVTAAELTRAWCESPESG